MCPFGESISSIIERSELLSSEFQVEGRNLGHISYWSGVYYVGLNSNLNIIDLKLSEFLIL